MGKRDISVTLESILSPKEISRFHDGWSSFKGKKNIASPHNVHGGFPIISEVFQFEDKPVFRARVFQGRNHLRKINPYQNAPYYLIPFWHPIHYITAGEQMYHGMMELHRPNNNKLVATEIPELDLKEKLCWPGRVNGHVSGIGMYKVLAGSWERGKAVERYVCLFYDDKKEKVYGSFNATIFLTLRSHIKTLKYLRDGKDGSQEKMIRLIQDQAAQHKYLLQPRTDLTSSSEELIETIRKDKIPPESDMINFFSLYDIKPQSKQALNY